jgi:hypothetical protein
MVFIVTIVDNDDAVVVVVENDDAVILDYAQPGYDPKAITGSAATQPSVEDYQNESKNLL